MSAAAGVGGCTVRLRLSGRARWVAGAGRGRSPSPWCRSPLLAGPRCRDETGSATARAGRAHAQDASPREEGGAGAAPRLRGAAEGAMLAGRAARWR